jgi:hypothetical protein
MSQLDIRFDPPGAPGSETSRLAAARMTQAKRRPQWYAILEALSGCRYAISREELSIRTGIKESSLCARLAALHTALCVDISSGSCLSSAGVAVDGYRVSEAGRARLVDGPGSTLLPSRP